MFAKPNYAKLLRKGKPRLGDEIRVELVEKLKTTGIHRLGQELGVSGMSISRFLHYENTRLDTVHALAKALGVTELDMTRPL